jgi:hypothetical protein
MWPSLGHVRACASYCAVRRSDSSRCDVVFRSSSPSRSACKWSVHHPTVPPGLSDRRGSGGVHQEPALAPLQLAVLVSAPATAPSRRCSCNSMGGAKRDLQLDLPSPFLLRRELQREFSVRRRVQLSHRLCAPFEGRWIEAGLDDDLVVLLLVIFRIPRRRRRASCRRRARREQRGSVVRLQAEQAC